MPQASHFQPNILKFIAKAQEKMVLIEYVGVFTFFANVQENFIIGIGIKRLGLHRSIIQRDNGPKEITETVFLMRTI